MFALEVSKHWDPAPAGAPPIFTLYDDRSVIYFDDQEKVHKHVVLSEAEFNRLSKILLNPNILTLKRHYIIVWGVTCQDKYYFTFRISDLIHSIYVYGHPTMNGHFTMIRERVTLPPEEIREIFSLVTQFKHKDATNWLPPKIEVFFWSYDDPPDESVIWPDSWPDLNDPNTVKLGESAYSVFLDSKHLDELKDFISTRKPKGAVLINGQKMAISYRIPTLKVHVPIAKAIRTKTTESRLRSLVSDVTSAGTAVSIKKAYITKNESKRVTIDEFSFRPLFLIPYKRYDSLGAATGFVVVHGKVNYLITNWHVVSGKYPTEEKIINEEGNVPESLLIVHHGKQVGSWVVKSEPLYDDMGKKRWLEHDRGRYVNIVALPLKTVTNDVRLYPIDLSLADANEIPEVAMPIFVVGFPVDLISPASFPIWKPGYIASEPNLESIFLVDFAAGDGMSGSPVVARLSNSYRTKESNTIARSSGSRTVFLGVYSRPFPPDTEMGNVWRPEIIREILNNTP